VGDSRSARAKPYNNGIAMSNRTTLVEIDWVHRNVMLFENDCFHDFDLLKMKSTKIVSKIKSKYKEYSGIPKRNRILYKR
tara:strand:+ start:368 stop:607 length:240 start_codon:yes stop_codon:yes gene_type:complete